MKKQIPLPKEVEAYQYFLMLLAIILLGILANNKIIVARFVATTIDN